MLHLRVSNRSWRADNGLKTSWRRDGHQAVLTIGEESSRFELRYVPPGNPVPHELDFTPFVEPEDFDFGLFIANVLNDEKRLALMRGADE